MKLQRNDYLESAYQMLLEEELRPGRERLKARGFLRCGRYPAHFPGPGGLNCYFIFISVYTFLALYAFFTLKLPISIHRRFTDCKSS